MDFNLTTFLVQIVNLFLLVWLLKRFLYRPVLAIIEKRRQEVIHNIQEAEKKLTEAEQTQKTLSKLKEDYEKQRQKRFSELDQEIHQQHAQMMKSLEVEFAQKRQKLQDDLNSNWTMAEATIHQMIGKEFLALAQKILTEWSHQSPVDQMLTLFGNKIVKLAASKRNQIQKILLAQKSIQVISSTKLNQKQQQALRGVLLKNFTLPPKIRFQYKQQSHLILGLEIRIGDFSLDWNLNNYLDEMNQHLKQGISGLIVPAKRKVTK